MSSERTGLAGSLTGVDAPHVVIDAARRGPLLRPEELWSYRGLLMFLVWRDVKVRYKQTLLGAAWAVLQPTLTMAVFSVVFGGLAGIGSEGLPYPIFCYAALLPWTFFAQGLTQSANSLVGSSHLITKVYFPRLVIPLATVLAGLVDFVLAFAVLLVLMAVYGIWPGWAILGLPALLALCFTASLGAGLWLSALNVQFRDVRYVVPFLLQIWLFVTPVIYPARAATERLAALGLPAWLYGCNPLTGVVEGFRWALLGVEAPPGSLIWSGAAATALLAVSGLLYFRRMERTFADVV